MNGDLTDGSIILMHDIHEPSVQAAIKMIPELVQKGYKLMTVSELAAAKGVTLQGANYSDFWDSSLAEGNVPGYSGNTTGSSGDETTDVRILHDGSSDDSMEWTMALPMMNLQMMVHGDGSSDDRKDIQMTDPRDGSELYRRGLLAGVMRIK